MASPSTEERDPVAETMTALVAAGFTCDEARTLSAAMGSADPYAIRLARRAIDTRSTVTTFVDLVAHALNHAQEVTS